MNVTESYVDVSKLVKTKCPCGCDSVAILHLSVMCKKELESSDKVLEGHHHSIDSQTFSLESGNQLCLVVNAAPDFDMLGFVGAVQQEKHLARSGQQRI